MKSLLDKLRTTRKPSLALGAAGLVGILALLRMAWLGIEVLSEGSQPDVEPAATLAGRVPVIPAPSDFLQATGTTSTVTSNLFHSRHIDHYLTRVAAQKEEEAALLRKVREEETRKAREEATRRAREEAARLKAQELAATQVALPPSTPITPAPSVPHGMVKVIYQGLMQMADGQTLALIGLEPSSNRAGTFLTGERCFGAVVTNITTDAVSLILTNGAVRRLTAGQPEPILEISLHEKP